MIGQFHHDWIEKWTADQIFSDTLDIFSLNDQGHKESCDLSDWCCKDLKHKISVICLLVRILKGLFGIVTKICVYVCFKKFVLIVIYDEVYQSLPFNYEVYSLGHFLLLS